MTKNSKSPSIPLLSKVAKATMFALPAVLLTVNTANADTTFPNFGANEKYLNHINYAAEPGKNLIPNPTFEICTDNLDANIYQDIYTLGANAADDEPGDCSKFGWSWFKFAPNLKAKSSPPLANPYGVISPHFSQYKIDDTHPSGHEDLKAYGRIMLNQTNRLLKMISVTNVNEIYVSFDYFSQAVGSKGGPNLGTFNIVVGSAADGIRYAVPQSHAASWEKVEYALELPAQYSGVIGIEYVPGANGSRDRIDNIFLSTNVIVPLSDSDGDGTPDKYDDDDDNDGYSDINEIAAGTDPFNKYSNVADLDGDGWLNDDDAFPNEAALHHADFTNVLADYSGDAETAEVYLNEDPAMGSEFNYQWHGINHAGEGVEVEHTVVDVTGYDGQTTKAFRLSVPEVGDDNTLRGSHVRFESKKLITANQNVDTVRVTGRFKVSGSAPSFEAWTDKNKTAYTDSVYLGLDNTVVDGDSTKRNALIHGWRFHPGAADEALYNSTENNGWVDFDVLFEFDGAIVDSKVQFLLKTDTAGVEVHFDDLEMFYINSADFANIADHDNDDILNSLDTTPLGSDAIDMDLDGILDGYDDDMDGDGISNAFDEFAQDIDGDNLNNADDLDDDGDGVVDTEDDFPFDKNKSLNTPPVITVAENVTFTSSSTEGAVITDTIIADFLAAVTATDVDDGALEVTNDAPETFLLDEAVVVTFTATDSNGVTVTGETTVTVVDTAPVITLNGNPFVFVTEGDTYVELGATAEDNLDGDLTADILTSGTVDTSTRDIYIITYTVSDDAGNERIITREVRVGGGVDTDGDAVPDEEDAFPNNPDEQYDFDGDLIGDNADPDIDNDGVLNENDADNYDPVSRENDLDRDGIADDVDSDGVNIIDAITALNTELSALPNGVISLDATNIETDITGTVSAFVLQTLINAGIIGVEVNSIDGGALRRSGSHDLMVELINSAGSLKTFDAVLNITPIVFIPPTLSVRADEEITINLTLSGEALSYPVTFAYRFEPIAEEAVAIEEGELTILEGQAHTLTLTGQMDGDYQVLFSEGADRNAAILGNAVTLIYAETNIAPAFDVALMNDGKVVTLLDQTATNAAIAITITDVDGLTEHNVVVSLNGEELFTGSNDVTNPVEIVTIDVATLGAGEHELEVVVTELATDDLYSTSQTIALTIVEALPVLEDTIKVKKEDGTFEDKIVDTDKDGISDAEEGFGDTDGDGIADYLDNSGLANKQNVSIVVVTIVDDEEVETIEQTNITVDNGLAIVLGDTLKTLESGLSDDIGVAVNAETFVDVLAVAEDNQDAVEASLVDVQSFLIPMIDFKIKGVDAGATVNMIIKLPFALPLKSAYRKVQDDGSLVAFDTTNGDSIMSAMNDEGGDCPAADSETWQTGLVKGDDCVKVAIVDGGVNDDDGTTNGVIVDPAVIVEVNSLPVVSIAGQASVNENTPVTLIASVSDADGIYVGGDDGGDILTYSWTQTQGTKANLAYADTTSLIATPSAAGGEDLVFMITVSDDHGGTTTSTVTVAVNDYAPAVSASASASAVNGGDEVTLSAIVSYQDNNPLTYLWVQTSGHLVTITAADSAVATFTSPNTDTTLTFELMVIDWVNETSKVSLSVDVSAVEETEKDSGGTFGTSALLFLAGLVGIRRKVKRAKLR